MTTFHLSRTPQEREAAMRRLPIIAVTLFFLLFAITGCSESVEHRIQRAKIALQSSKPDIALQLVEPILKKDPNHVEAMLIKTNAQLGLLQLDRAKNTLDQLLQSHPTNAEAHRLAVRWVYQRLYNLLRQSDFASSEERRNQFTQAALWGKTHVDWFAKQPDGRIESDFIAARFILVDADRLALLISQLRKTIGSVDPNASDPVRDQIVSMEKEIDDLKSQASGLLSNVVTADPRHFTAADIYASLLIAKRNWPDIWILGQLLSKQKDIPADVAGRVVLALLIYPENLQPASKSLELAQQIQSNVEASQQKSTDWRLAQARIHIRSNDTVKALTDLDSLLKQDPKHNIARYLKAQCLYTKQDYAQARTILAELSSQVRSSEIQTLYGMVLMELNDLALAKENLLRAMDFDPDDPAPRRAYLMVQAKANALDQAGPTVDDFYRKNPNDPNAIRFKYQYEQVRNRRDAVEALLESTQRIRPLTPQLLSILTDGYLYLQKYDQAERWAKEHIRLQPDELQAHLRLAQTLMMQNRDDDVQKLLASIKQKFPDRGSIDQLLAELYIQRQSFDRAVDILQKILDQSPSDTTSRIMLVRALMGLSLFEDALEQIQKILETDPRSMQAHASASQIYQLMGRTDRSAYHLEQIDVTQVDERTSPALLAELKLRQNQIDEAADICNRALSLGNTDPALRRLLTTIYLRKNQPEQAEINLAANVRNQPNNAQAYVMLARFYIEQKAIDKGLSELANLQTLNEPLSRLSQAILLISANRWNQVIPCLGPIYEPLVRSRDSRALAVADGISRAVLVTRNDLSAALQIYQPLIDAELEAGSARLRQIDLQLAVNPKFDVVSALNAVAAKLNPDDRQVRLSLINRYLRLRQPVRALELVDQWLQQAPQNVTLLRLRAEILVQTDRTDDAIAAIQTALKYTPDDDAIYRQLAAIYYRIYNFPQAQAAYLQATQFDQGAKINALSDLGQMFVSLGLHQQATEVFNQLEKQTRVRDPRLKFAMGRALFALQQFDQAKSRIQDIPDYTSQYAPAQVLLAQIEQQTGQIDQARTRLEKLMADSRTASLASSELLRLNLRTKQAEDLIRWSDEKLAMDNLPVDLRRNWINVRIGMADARRDNPLLLDSIDRLLGLHPDLPQVIAAKILVLVRDNKIEQAKNLYASQKNLASSPTYSTLLAVLLGEQPAIADSTPPLDALLACVARADIPKAQSYLAQLPIHRTIYPSDIQPVLQRPDVTGYAVQNEFRQLAASLLALRCNLPQLSADLAQGVIERIPGISIAHALRVQALLDMDAPVDQALLRLQQSMPNAGITLFVQASQTFRNKDYDQTVQLLTQLYQREPANDHIAYSLSQSVILSSKPTDAIPILEKLYAKTTSPYAIPAANDMAYILAEYQPDRIEQAYTMARSAVDKMSNNPAALDTIGWIEHLRGNDQAALASLSKAIVGLNAAPDIHYHLGVVYQRLNNKNWAKYHLQEAIRIGQDSPNLSKMKAALSSLN